MKNEKTIDDKNLFRGVSTLDFAAKNIKQPILLFLLTMIFSGLIYANGGTNGGHSILDAVDQTFDPQISTSSFGDKNVSAIEILPDGKILVAGKFNSYNRQPVGGFVRLNADASLDTTFNNNVVPTDKDFKGILLQPDGRIILYGSQVLIRLNSDGTLDSGFNNASPSFLQDAAIDANGRIILITSPSVVRLNQDGSLDSSFKFISIANVSAVGVAIQNNKVIVSLSDLTSGVGKSVVKRLNEDGSDDPTFTQMMDANSAPGTLIVQPDKKILFLNATLLKRLNENGGIDNSFQPGDFRSPALARTMRLGNDGKITVVTDEGTFLRFLSNGQIDPSFRYRHLRFKSFALQPDGGVIIGDSSGAGSSGRNDFVRLLPNGTLDVSFNSGIGFQTTKPGSVSVIGTQADGKVLIGGKFNEVNNLPRPNIARLNFDSTVDTSFQINMSGTGNYFSQFRDVYNIKVQPDGKLVITGGFTYFLNGVQKANVVRLNTDGSIDPTFNLSIIINDSFAISGGGKNRFVILDNGKIIVGASRSGATGVAVPIRLNSDGVHDNTFNPTIFSNSNSVFIMDLAVQPDGKILISGRHSFFTSPTVPGSITKSFIARLNPDGSTDQNFQLNEETDKEISAFRLLPDGKILIAKLDFPLSVRQPTKLFRLNSDGSVDNSFNTGAGVNGNVNAFLVLPNGKIMVGGKFTTFNGQPRGNLALINADGSLDPMNFNLNQEVLSLTIDSQGRVLVSGDFTAISVDGGQNNARTYVARLIDSSAPAAGRTPFDFDGDGKADLAVFAQSDGNWSIRNSQANQVSNTKFGLTGDKTVAADYDNDGKTDLAVYRPSEGNWYLLRSTAGFTALRWGAAEDKPVTGDFDGNGSADIAVWRPTNGVWYILQNGATPVYHYFGTAGDIPIPADFDGDGKTDVAVFRPSSGTFYWLASGSNNQFKAVQFGLAGDIPVVADYNGDGKDDLVVFRPSDGIWYQYLTTQAGDYTFTATRFGLNGDEPVAADYNGDGKADIAVRRQGVWHMMMSGQSYTSATFGTANAQAVVALPNNSPCSIGTTQIGVPCPPGCVCIQ